MPKDLSMHARSVAVYARGSFSRCPSRVDVINQTRSSAECLYCRRSISEKSLS
jgi:hypothetical protein